MKRMKRDSWIKLIEEWKKSGLTKTAFCREKGISKASFYKRLNQLEDGLPQKPVHNNSFLEIAIPSFVEPKAHAARILRIVTSYGVTLEIPL